MDYAVPRRNMVESQVRPSDVTDRRIIRAMADIPREFFVPEASRPVAYMDGPISLSSFSEGALRTMLEPRTFAKLIQAAQIEPTAAVLDIGVATGYSSAVLARLGGRVVALEVNADLAALARETLAKIGAEGIEVVTGDLAAGWSEGGPYDAIVIEGAIETVPPGLLDQLKDGGRLVAIQSRHGAGRATVWRRDGSVFGTQDVFDANSEVLPGFERPPAFVF
ncbi:protein-L-isoaspartate O-methyltransferase [Hyphomicrobium sp.]|uniref:protein-L-isoaspartate O-methyltransferase family protein n=1 Tax=Hyphomicrobium sp. TaxID=82 RepID=UPI002B788115|nr:protein-L-isoaspartate O-methyltransferase [Hyphomicrobium sp.]HRN88579.1 protein-L-isoaspartate O-methyltransferase [Hyphomicrobium sp.]HRQ27091.1 protein-L-isoaspartate O-methyltransferase [Hyphomicrobium sp.]